MKKISILLVLLSIVGTKTYAQTCVSPITMPASGGSENCTVGSTAVTFLDPGGAGNYANNITNSIQTICPVTGTSKVKITFSAFNTESGLDLVNVYDGNSTAAPQVSGSPFSGTSIPAAITSTAANGCLTFKFTSDLSATRAGFTASLQEVVPPPSCFTAFSPAQGATGVSVPPLLSWGAVAGATSYDVYVSTSSTFPNAYDYRGKTTGTSAQVLGLSGSTLYYWKIVPKDASNVALATCTANTQSFTTGTVSGTPLAEACSNPLIISSSVSYLGSLCNSGCQSAADPSMGNVGSAFCGLADNLEFVRFVASGTSASFNIVSSAATSLQLDIMSATSCTGTWTHAGSTSCFNGVSLPATVTFNGLTSGNTYYLVLDNVSGGTTNWSISASTGVAVCNISALTATAACSGATYGVTGQATFTNPPAAGGNLLIKVDGVLQQTIPVTASPMSYSVTGLTADGASHTVSAEFSADAACSRTQTYTAPATCAVSCSMTALAVTAGACNDNGTNSNATDDYYTADVTITFANKPATGNLVLSGTGLHSSNTVTTVAVGSTTSATTHTFTGVKIKANGAVTSLTGTFDAAGTCTFTNAAVTAVNACSNCTASSTMTWN